MKDGEIMMMMMMMMMMKEVVEKRIWEGREQGNRFLMVDVGGEDGSG